MKRRISVLLICMLLVTLFTSCTNKPGQSEEQKTLSIAVANPWEGTDMYQCTWGCYTTPLVADGLLTFDIETGELKPNIAESFNISEDGKTIRLTIPEDLKFGNGQALTPEDVKKSIEWGLKVSWFSTDYAAIEDIQVEGKDVIITLKDFSATVLYYLTSYYMSVLDNDQIEQTVQEDLLTTAIPYGSFYIKEFEPDSYVKLLRNDSYKTNNVNYDNKGKSNFSEAVVKFIADPFSRISLLKSGEVDICFDIPTENVKELRDDPNIEVIEYVSPGINYITVNKDNPVFQDIRVRKALAYAMDRELLSSKDYSISPLYSFLVEEMMDYSDKMEKYYKENYCNNIDKSKELLAEAGWADSDGDGILDKDGTKFEFTLLGDSEDTGAKNITQLIQSELKELGISVKIETIERRYLGERVRNDNYDARLYYYYWAEPFTMFPYLLTDQNNLENQEYYDYLAEGVKMVNSEDRQEALNNAQKILMDEAAFIPLFKKSRYIAYNKNVTGIKKLSDATVLFNDINKK